MQDLTAKFSPAGAPLSLLVPSSQEGGNLVQEDLAERTMTAPGSEPVSPLPPALEGAHPTPTQSHATIPVSFPGDQTKPAVQAPHQGDGSRPWHPDRMGVHWKETETGVPYDVAR